MFQMSVNIYRLNSVGERSKSYKSLNRVLKIEDEDEEFISITTAYDNEKIFVSKEDHCIEVFIN